MVNVVPHPGVVIVESHSSDSLREMRGFVVPNSQKDESAIVGQIVSKTDSDDKDLENKCKFYSVGDRVYFKKWSGTKISEEGNKQLLAVKIDDLLCKVPA